MVTEGVIQVLWSVYFKWISRDAFYVLYFCVCLNFVTGFIGCLFHDSPVWNYGTERFEDVHAMIAKIAKWNNKLDYVKKKFPAEDDVMILVEEADPTNRGTVEQEQNFNSLLRNSNATTARVNDHTSFVNAEKKEHTRYMTSEHNPLRMTRGQSVVQLNDQLTNLRLTSH